MEKSTPTPPQLALLERFVRLMDSKFRFPGLPFRFGLEPIIGLIPFAGDVVTLAISSGLVFTMARHGASGGLIVKMLLNVALDFLIGLIPVIGDIFDFSFKANTRNYNLLREYYGEGAHQGSAWRVLGILLAGIVLFVLGLVILAGWLVAKLFSTADMI